MEPSRLEWILLARLQSRSRRGFSKFWKARELFDKLERLIFPRIRAPDLSNEIA
jgi:hypothetical protein